MRGAIVTGVWGAGKSSVCHHIRARLVASGCETLICIPQAATITTHTYIPGTTAAEHAAGVLSWMSELTRFLTDTDHRFHASTLPGHRCAPVWTPTALLEAVSFDIPVYQLPVHRAQLLGVEDTLARLGLHLVVLHVPEHRIQAQCVASTRRHRGPKWDTYLHGFGDSDTARAAAIGRAQHRLMGWVHTSPLSATIIDSSGGDWNRYARQITELIETPAATTHARHPRNRSTR